MATQTARASSTSFTYAPGPSGPAPPFQGPPPVPQGWNVNQGNWNAGFWQYNPNFQPTSAPAQSNPPPWMPDPRWAPQQYAQQQQQQQQQAQQQQQQSQQNPYKRPIKPPSAEYMATKLTDNGLGLSGMEPAVGTPWIWNPRGLVEEAVPVGEITADYRDQNGRILASEPRGLEPRRNPEKPYQPRPPDGPGPVVKPQSQPIRGQRQSTEPQTNREPAQRTPPQPPQQQPQPPIYRNSASGAASGTPAPASQTKRAPAGPTPVAPLARFATAPNLSRPVPENASSSRSPPPPEGFTSQGALRPTFSPNIVRTPDSYSHSKRTSEKSRDIKPYETSPRRQQSEPPMSSLATRLMETYQEQRGRGTTPEIPDRDRDKDRRDKDKDRDRPSRRASTSESRRSSTSDSRHEVSRRDTTSSSRRSSTSASREDASLRRHNVQNTELTSPPGATPGLPQSRPIGRHHSVPVVGTNQASSNLPTIPEASSRHVSSASAAARTTMIPMTSPGELSTAKYNGASSGTPAPVDRPTSRSHSRSHSSNSSPTSGSSSQAYSSSTLRRSNTSSQPYTSSSSKTSSKTSPGNNGGMPYGSGPSPPSQLRRETMSPTSAQYSQPVSRASAPPSSANYYTSSSSHASQYASHRSSASTSTPDARSTPTPSQGYSQRVRKGYWNKRGDHLTRQGNVVYAPDNLRYPLELQSYPDVKEGYMNERKEFAKFEPSRAELPESLPRHGRPPSMPYEKFVIYR